MMDYSSDGIYSWQMWKQDSTNIRIDLSVDSIYVDDEIFLILEKPKRWVIKKNLKYVSFSCGDEFFNKVNVKLYQYDSGEFRIYIMEEKKAIKYTVKYLGDSTPRILLDKSDVKSLSEEKKHKEQNSTPKKEKPVIKKDSEEGKNSI